VVVRDHRRRGEVAPAEFYCSLEEGVLERVAPAVFGFPQRREFPGEQTVWFLLRWYSIHAEHHVGVTALWEILLLESFLPILCGGRGGLIFLMPRLATTI
jgi:hypothetical protein